MALHALEVTGTFAGFVDFPLSPESVAFAPVAVTAFLPFTALALAATGFPLSHGMSPLLRLYIRMALSLKFVK